MSIELWTSLFWAIESEKYSTVTFAAPSLGINSNFFRFEIILLSRRSCLTRGKLFMSQMKVVAEGSSRYAQDRGRWRFGELCIDGRGLGARNRGGTEV